MAVPTGAGGGAEPDGTGDAEVLAVVAGLADRGAGGPASLHCSRAHVCLIPIPVQYQYHGL